MIFLISILIGAVCISVSAIWVFVLMALSIPLLYSIILGGILGSLTIHVVFSVILCSYLDDGEEV